MRRWLLYSRPGIARLVACGIACLIYLYKTAHVSFGMIVPVHADEKWMLIHENHTYDHNKTVALESFQDLPSWLKAYIDFHNQSWRTTRREFSYLQWVCRSFCGGAGDRISGVVQTFYMAMCTDRVLMLDWKVPAPLTNYLEPRWIQWNPDASATHLPPMNQSIKAMRKENPYLRNPYNLSKSIPGIEIATNKWLVSDEDNKVSLVAKSDCVQDYWHRFQEDSEEEDSYNPQLFRLAFWTLFQWSPAVVQRVQSIRERRFFSTGPYVAIHIRTGRLGHTVDRIRESSREETWTLYHACAKRFQESLQHKCGQNEVPIYLAADTPTVKQKFGTWDPTIRSDVDMEIYHIDRTDPNVLEDPDTAELDAWADLKLLVDSTCLVKTKSKYSRLADWLPRQPRCSAYYDDCGIDTVVKALDTVTC